MPMGTGLGGGSFLGTAAATVAGVVGGAMLLNGIRSMMGGNQGFGDNAPTGPSHMASPWDSPARVDPGAGSGDLARDAGIGDIGGQQTAARGEPDRAGFVGNTDDTSDTSGDDYANAGDDGDANDGGDYSDGGDFGGDGSDTV
jgi:hypothetical protein